MKNRYAVSVTYIKPIPTGNNIQSILNIFTAVSKQEAKGIALEYFDTVEPMSDGGFQVMCILCQKIDDMDNSEI